VAERIIFPNAPITEALLDIRVSLPGETNLDRLANFHNTVKEQYPNKRVRKSWKGGVRIKEGHPELLESQGGPDGYLFTSSDGRQVVQARLDGFTFNRMKPYDRWETFRDQAKALWQIYVKIACPKQITRIALRYINRIEIPLPIRDFKDYILTCPEIAPGLPQGLAKLFMHLTIPVPEIPAMVLLAQTMEPVTDTNKLPLIFDIDVFRETGIDIESEELWKTFEKLHELKNDVFFKSITDEARELFK